ncbi:PilW family protein [Rhodanobacter sp. Col0626]|uniref:PilW family protein n=1 Tax=Rhodanobacter sp. Col0626 TaxID=3415679 RepID=UPI003CFA87B4
MRVSIRSSRQSGLTLIELMVAMVLGLLVAAGIVTVFASTSSSNKAQTQLATLQEEGRFAIARIRDDLGMLNSQYGTTSGGNASQSGTGLPYLDGLRAPSVYANDASSNLLLDALSDVTTSWGDPYPVKPTSGPYSMPSFLSMRGYDCTITDCTPIDPNDSIATIPAMGTVADTRVKGASVLTMRYLNPARGWAIQPSNSTITGSTLTTDTDGNTLKQIDLKPMSGEPPVTDVKTGHLIMLANYSNAQVFAVTGQGTATLVPSTANFSMPTAMVGTNAVKAFDFDRDFQTVTYYLKVVDAGNGHTTGALVRRVNGGEDNKTTRGGTEDELVRGIERLDFKYGVISKTGDTQFLTAEQVDTAKDASGNAIACPPGEANPVAPAPIQGCLWRAVQSVEVDLLMDGQIPLYTLTPNEEQYTYSFDTTTTALTPPASHAIKPSDQGFVDQMLRREFTALIAVRNFNP